MHPPGEIAGYRIVRPLGRGFYSATYLATRGRLGHEYVLKVTPSIVYPFFSRPDYEKNFEKECQKHKEVAEGSEHIIDIIDMEPDVAVTFGDVTIECNVAMLDYVKGVSLGDILSGKVPVTPRMIAQIVVDLFRILGDLEDKQVRHNDLHGGNVLVEHLEPDPRRTRRKGAIDETVRAVAIDLGSVLDASRSDYNHERWGDIHYIARHLTQLVDRLISDPESRSDHDYRIAAALEEVAHFLYPGGAHQRHSFRDLEERVRAVVDQVQAPWREPFKLRNFNDSYNAQTLAPWYVPLLLVDPDDQWVRRIAAPGPQVITGMRGCGKTLLLRAVEFHARAADRGDDSGTDILTRLHGDGFVGLYVSSTRLLDRMGIRNEVLHKPYARLFVAYVREAISALQHLSDLDDSRDLVRTNYVTSLAEVVAEQLKGADEVREIESPQELDRALFKIMISLARGDELHDLTAHPVTAFTHLADAVRRASMLWENSTVLFLLDDVSTRHLEHTQIQELLSQLLFSDPTCAFKLSSETQTLELVLRSPGFVERARAGRDYDVFDLGAEVMVRMKRSKGAGRRFIEQILERRARHYSAHPMLGPADVLGDTTLEAVAKTIASLPETDSGRKKVYHGISVLSAVCVGDIGDVIQIYDLMLRRAGRGFPIAPEIQSPCYQEICSRKLYDLNRREATLKDFAMSFAQASYRLLLQSYHEIAGPKGPRIRQYLKIYVRITTGDVDQQFKRLRDLVDAGVFVLSGGTDSPRQKTRDADPIQQFTLTYRKLFGLSHYIGLAERDRFELSGAELEDWLLHPERGEEILLRNLLVESDDDELDATVDDTDVAPQDQTGSRLDTERRSPPESGTRKIRARAALTNEQMILFAPDEGVSDSVEARWVQERMAVAVPLSSDTLAHDGVEHLVLGLGFEERTLRSAERILASVRPRRVTLVRYDELGQGAAIQKVVRRTPGVQVEVVPYGAFLTAAVAEPLFTSGTLVDVTGLAKPVIFHYVRQALRTSRRVWISHTYAEQYYPLNEDVQRVLEADEQRNEHQLLEALRGILTGEEGPYELDRLFYSESDHTRRRVLCAFASPKHERLLSLLDERDYDHIEIISPGHSTPRHRVADLAAEVAVRKVRSGEKRDLDPNDLPSLLGILGDQFHRWYVQHGFNFEVGLTGSKLQAVAAAAASVTMRISEAWYVRPQRFDPLRFTRGVGETVHWRLDLPIPPSDLGEA